MGRKLGVRSRKRPIVKEPRKRDLEDENNYFADVDEDNLDVEWSKQPKLVLRYGLRLADAKADHADAKVELDLVKAELDQSIRESPGHFRIKKRLTEKAIENTIPMQVEYQRALRIVNKSKHRVDVLQAVINALEHRKKGLEDAVYLFSIGYNGEPKAPYGSGRELANEIVKRKTRKGKRR